MQTNDELWKGAIEDLRFEFIQKFYPELYPYIDSSHENPIEFLDKELAQLHADSEIGLKKVDKLMGVHLRGIRDMRIIYIHVEAQGYYDPVFDERNFTYFYRLIDLYGKNVTVLVILTDTSPNYNPAVYKYDFMGVHLTYEYPVYKILMQDPEALAASENLFDVTFLTAYWAIKKKRRELTDEKLSDLKLDLMRRLLSKNVSKIKIRKLFDFIKQYVSFEKPEIAATFERQFDELVKIEKNMGITEILIRQAEDRVQAAAQAAAQQAREERKNTVRNMRAHNFSAERIADIVGYSLNEVHSFFNELDSEI